MTAERCEINRISMKGFRRARGLGIFDDFWPGDGFCGSRWAAVVVRSGPRDWRWRGWGMRSSFVEIRSGPRNFCPVSMEGAKKRGFRHARLRPRDLPDSVTACGRGLMLLLSLPGVCRAYGRRLVVAICRQLSYAAGDACLP